MTPSETWPGPVSLEALSRRLGIAPAVLDGMLAELVRMGRLVRLDPRSGRVCGVWSCQWLPVRAVGDRGVLRVPTSLADNARSRPDLVCPTE
ncbi:MAG: hypothetical protein HZY76_07905 [Anaerolineae bacterium]|nr:MAG: hypothetical protein HZY76_07905 [Anaerolineae bacterium]